MLLAVREQNVHQRFMRDRFFPQEKLYSQLKVYRFARGVLQESFCVDSCGEETGGEVNYYAFFHTAADGSVVLFWNKTDNGESGDLRPGTYCMPFATRQSRYLAPCTGVMFGSKTRLGAVPDDRADILWYTGTEIRCACLDLSEIV